MKDKEQLSFVGLSPRQDNADKVKRNWENAFQKWSNKGMMGARGYNDYYGVCGTSSICDYCKDNSYGRPCVRALNEKCREEKITIDYTKRDFREIWGL